MKEEMKNITIYLPELYLKNIQNLINADIIRNRSEAIRIAIREFLETEYYNLETFGYFKEIERGSID